ncbi:hypothetical protein R2F25_37730 [Streptomyces sp. UP1A-1]|nr:hypothetical protein [Streptomyces sp. UP1A-1]
MRNTRAQTRLYLTGDEMEPLRAVMRELVELPEAARHLAGIVSGVDIRYDMGPGDHPLLGLRLAPGHELLLEDGGRTRVAELLHPARGVLLVTGAADDAARVRGAAARLGRPGPHDRGGVGRAGDRGPSRRGAAAPRRPCRLGGPGRRGTARAGTGALVRPRPGHRAAAGRTPSARLGV